MAVFKIKAVEDSQSLSKDSVDIPVTLWIYKDSEGKLECYHVEYSEREE